MIEVTPEQFRERFRALAEALGADDLHALLAVMDVQELVPSEALIAEGTPVEDLFLVWDGQLDVSIATPRGERPVGRVGVGSFLGEVALLDPGLATATVTADHGCTVLQLGRARFDDLCSDRPEVAAALLGEIGRTLAERLRNGVALLDASSTASGPEPLLAVHGALHGEARS